MNKKRSTGLLLSILGVISLILITAGVTYAFFSYTKEGQTVNTISTARIRFKYTEGVNTLQITNALPLSDTDGKTQTTGGTGIDAKSFAFTVTSETPQKAEIPYIVTISKQAGSTLSEDEVKLYLVVSGTADKTGVATVGNKTVDASDNVLTISELPTGTTLSASEPYTWVATGDRVIYAGVVPQNSTYNKSFTLGMWIKNTDASGNELDYSAYEFIKKSLLTGTTAADVDDLTAETDGFLKSTDYYRRINLDSSDTDYINPDNYTRVAYVNYTTSQVIGVSQGVTAAPSADWDANEQYYPYNGKEYKVKVNVYAEGTTVYEN